MADLHPQDLIDRYLAGELDKPTAEWVRMYLEARPGRQGVIAGFRAAVRGESIAPAPDLRQSKERFFAKLDAEERLGRGAPSHQAERAGQRWYARWYTMAGVVCGALMLAAVWQMGIRQPTPYESSTNGSTYTTANAERATITLPDGSTILLNVGSRVQVPTNYSAKNRTVKLSGEALFTVKPLSGAPFTVVAGPSTTRVLGTSFVVRHYETDTAAIVAVREGKVAVGELVLTAAQATTVTKFGTTGIVPADTKQFGFANGVLEFDYRLFPEAIPELNRWYNADIRLGDSTLVTKKIVGVFKAGSLTDLISVLELTFGVRVVRDGNVLTLYGGR
jgi:ferric-dicitrate binding protein FerR (iron transport regulator)